MALKEQPTPHNMEVVNAIEYRSIVGALQYLTYIRPNRVHTINKVCQSLQSSTMGDIK